MEIVKASIPFFPLLVWDPWGAYGAFRTATPLKTDPVRWLSVRTWRLCFSYWCQSGPGAVLILRSGEGRGASELAISDSGAKTLFPAPTHIARRTISGRPPSPGKAPGGVVACQGVVVAASRCTTNAFQPTLCVPESGWCIPLQAS